MSDEKPALVETEDYYVSVHMIWGSAPPPGKRCGGVGIITADFAEATAWLKGARHALEWAGYEVTTNGPAKGLKLAEPEAPK